MPYFKVKIDLESRVPGGSSLISNRSYYRRFFLSRWPRGILRLSVLIAPSASEEELQVPSLIKAYSRMACEPQRPRGRTDTERSRHMLGGGAVQGSPPPEKVAVLGARA